MNEKITTENGRVVYLDYLRLMATLAVVVLHVSAQNWANTDVNSSYWAVMNAYNGLARWCVPAFVMISGALFLPRQIDTKLLYKKYVLRLILLYFVWAAVYVGAYAGLSAAMGYRPGFSLTQFLTDILNGSYHLWYLPMLAGLYMCLPLLRPIVQNEKTARYFLLLAFLFTFALPQILQMLKDFSGGNLLQLTYAAETWLSNMHLQMVLGFTGYFVAGYVLSQTEFTPKQRTWIYVLGILGCAAAIALNLEVSRKNHYPLETYLYYLNVNVAVMAVAVFVWFRYHCKTEGRRYPLIRKLSQCTLGVYLIHPFLLVLMQLAGFNTLSFHPALSVSVISIAVVIGAFLVSCVLNKLPLVRKWLV